MMKKSLLLSTTALSVLFGAFAIEDASAAFQINANWKPAMYESLGVEGGSNFSDKVNVKGEAFNKVYTGMNVEGLYLFGDAKSSSRFGAGLVLGYQKVEANDEESSMFTALVPFSQSNAGALSLVEGKRFDLTQTTDDVKNFVKVTVDEVTGQQKMVTTDKSVTGTGTVSTGTAFTEKTSMQVGVKLAYEYDMGNLVLGAGVSGSWLPTTLKWANITDTVDGTAKTHALTKENEQESEFNGFGYGLDATVAYQMGMFALKFGLAWDQAFETELSGEDTPVPVIDNGSHDASDAVKANNGIGNTSSDKFKVSEGALSLLAGVSISF